MLSRIVTGDKMWISHVIPKSKQQSIEWRHTHSPVRVKAKPTLPQRKIMASLFWDRHGVLLIDFMQRGTTINAVTYSQTLRKLRRATQNKRRGMLTEGILLLHDNARPHTTAQTRALLDSFGWEVLDPPQPLHCAERFSSFPPSQTSSRRQPLQRCRRRENSRDLLVIGAGGKFL
ncbi:Mariner Mos1 transposase [Araneus ventricosus]|uniref:Mariner Mos1 transposase n=1 Tax=Araneus ventricosus TaxID=182803 RepID=A0A4Y2AS77_ARAVE|nr:Mariner Mos1 transposase [Araneus ventricosus]